MDFIKKFEQWELLFIKYRISCLNSYRGAGIWALKLKCIHQKELSCVGFDPGISWFEVRRSIHSATWQWMRAAKIFLFINHICFFTKPSTFIFSMKEPKKCFCPRRKFTPLDVKKPFWLIFFNDKDFGFLISRYK